LGRYSRSLTSRKRKSAHNSLEKNRITVRKICLACGFAATVNQPQSNLHMQMQKIIFLQQRIEETVNYVVIYAK
jgi:hypothetical protein